MYTRPQGRERMRRVKALLEPLIDPAGGRYLDLGCGLGRYTAWIADRTAGLVVGVDISRVSIENAEPHPNATYIRGSWDMAARLSDWDVILATEVLEHAEDPEGLIKRISSRMWSTWVVTVPCERPAPEENRWTLSGHGHLQSFDEKRVRGLFKEVKHFSTDGRYFYLVGR